MMAIVAVRPNQRRCADLLLRRPVAAPTCCADLLRRPVAALLRCRLRKQTPSSTEVVNMLSKDFYQGPLVSRVVTFTTLPRTTNLTMCRHYIL